MGYYYNCENGDDISIACFESYEDAYKYAMEDKKVKEIWKYEIAKDDLMGDVVELCWWNARR